MIPIENAVLSPYPDGARSANMLDPQHPTGGIGCVFQKEQSSEAVKLAGCDLARAVFHLLRGTSACRYIY